MKHRWLQARYRTKETLEAMRFRAVEASRAGMKPQALAVAYGVSTRTIFKWLSDFYKGGEQALRAKPNQDGRPSSTQSRCAGWRKR